MQGEWTGELVGPDVWVACRELIPAGPVLAFLAEHREQLFPASMFADMYPSANGGPSMPPQVLAAAKDADRHVAARATIVKMIRARLLAGEALPDLDEVRARARIGAPIEADITVEAWLRRWLVSETDLRPATRTSYGNIIDNYLVPTLGHHRVDRLRPSHIKEAMNDIAASAETIRAANAERHRVVAISKRAWREHEAAAARAARARLKELPLSEGRRTPPPCSGSAACCVPRSPTPAASCSSPSTQPSW